MKEKNNQEKIASMYKQNMYTHPHDLFVHMHIDIKNLK